MANYNLNDARKIVYLDKNGEQQAVKEVWYIGSAGGYKVWPGDIYLTDIKIEDQYGNEYDLEYVNNISFIMDVKIIIESVKIVLKKEHAEINQEDIKTELNQLEAQ